MGEQLNMQSQELYVCHKCYKEFEKTNASCPCCGSKSFGIKREKPSKTIKKHDETVGRVIFSASYFVYAIKRIIAGTIVSLLPLYLLDIPLYFAPLFGLAIFLIYRFLWRTVFRFFYKISRM